MIRVCFVCLGNICRSPTADGIMTHLVKAAGLADQIGVDSAGTGAWHVGEPADRRAREVAARRGYTLSSRARQFEVQDFGRFDYILAMDRSNYRELVAMAPSAGDAERVYLFRAFDPDLPAETTPPGEHAAREYDVPDPYYGGSRGFDTVFDMCERTCRHLVLHLKTHHL